MIRKIVLTAKLSNRLKVCQNLILNQQYCSGSTDEIRTKFGSKVIQPEEKQILVNELFHKVARQYDVMNDLMSAGVHRLWKDELLNMLSPSPDTDLLDVAGGTGDIAFRFCRYHEEFTGSVTVCDINPSMMEVGQIRSKSIPNADKIKWIEGNAECLPFPDNSFSAYTIAFGLRNVTNIEKVLKEARRVLKKGGRLLIMELSKVRNENLNIFYQIYKNDVIPIIGHLLYNNEAEYKYLAASIDNFPSQEVLVDILENCGFQFVTVTDLTFGVCAIHSAFVFDK